MNIPELLATGDTHNSVFSLVLTTVITSGRSRASTSPASALRRNADTQQPLWPKDKWTAGPGAGRPVQCPTPAPPLPPPALAEGPHVLQREAGVAHKNRNPDKSHCGSRCLTWALTDLRLLNFSGPDRSSFVSCQQRQDLGTMHCT